jgi:hypothetical protein
VRVLVAYNSPDVLAEYFERAATGGLAYTYVEQRRQQLAGFARERLVKRSKVERLFRADVERPRFGLSDETRGRFDHP